MRKNETVAGFAQAAAEAVRHYYGGRINPSDLRNTTRFTDLQSLFEEAGITPLGRERVQRRIERALQCTFN